MLREILEFVQEKIRTYYDKHRVEVPPLEEGDQIFFLTRNLHTKKLNKKLNFKKIGPFKVKKKILLTCGKYKVPSEHQVPCQSLVPGK